MSEGASIPVELLGERWLVGRAGTPFALVDRCAHRGTPIAGSAVIDGCVTCPYHGWRYDAAGRCVEVPSSGPGVPPPPAARLAPAAGAVDHLGLVWLALEPPVAPLPTFPEWDDPTATRVLIDPIETSVGCATFTDNFVDVAHFPFVHRSSFGAHAPLVVVDGLDPVIRDGWCVVSTNRTGYGKPDLAGDGGFDAVETVQRRTVTAPFGMRLRIDVPGGGFNAVAYVLQPLDARRTRIHKLVSYSDVHPDAAVALLQFEREVLREDIAELERLDDQDIELHSAAQVHVRADRPSLAVRRLWSDLLDADRAVAERSAS